MAMMGDGFNITGQIARIPLLRDVLIFEVQLIVLFLLILDQFYSKIVPRSHVLVSFLHYFHYPYKSRYSFYHS